MSSDNNIIPNGSQPTSQDYPNAPSNGFFPSAVYAATNASARLVHRLNITAKNLSGYTQIGQWRPTHIVRTSNDLEDLLSEYVLAMIGGKAVVARWGKELLPDGTFQEVFEVTSKEAFTTFHSNKVTTVDTGNGDVRTMPAPKHFFQKAKRRDGLVYLPHEGSKVGRRLNLWRGYGVEPTSGLWSRMLDHILEVICNGNENHALYVLRWCAWAVQNAGFPAEVAIVLQGREGTGKGAFAQMMLRIFGIHGKQISDRTHLAGKFNKHLMYTSLLFADEAFWAGDHKMEASLKRLITERTLIIEPKGVDAFSMPNCLHIIMASNEEWVVPAGRDARRFAVFAVSPKRMDDQAYFQALWAEINDGGPGAMLHDLLSMDLQGWHPRGSIPQTEALQEQKLLSLRGVPRLIFLLADEGKLPCLATPLNPAGVVTTGEGLGFGFISWAKRMVRSLSHMNGTMIKKELVRHWGCANFNRNGERGLDFPPLTTLRETFEKRYGPQNWENPNMDSWEVPFGSLAGKEVAQGWRSVVF